MAFEKGTRVSYVSNTDPNRFKEYDTVIAFDDTITTILGNNRRIIIEAPNCGWIPDSNTTTTFDLDMNKKYMWVNANELVLR